MTKFIVAIVIACTVSIPGLPVRAPEAGKTYRIGYLTPGAENRFGRRVDAFRQSLVELGYAVGKDAITEAAYAEG